MDGNIPWVKTKEVNNNKISVAETYITEEALAKSSAKLIPENSVIMAMYGNGDTAGRVAINKIPLSTNQACCNLVIDPEKADYRFVYYYLRTQYQRLVDLKNGGAQQNLNAGMIKEYPFPELPLDIQTNIADILEAFDDKIELNRQTNQTLEHIAQAIFKSWFVDFDPTRAKIAAKQAGQDPERAAMAAISGKALDELDQLSSDQLEQLRMTAGLFSDGLVDSELGEVPEGWKIKTLDEVTSTIIDHRGKTPKKLGGDWVEEGYPAVSAKNIKNGRVVRHDTIRFLNDELYAKWMKVEVEKGDILLTSEAPMGEMYFITDETKYCLSQRLYALRADNKNVTSSFLYLWLQTAIAQADLEGRATGTTVVGIRQVELRKVNALVPPLGILKVFEDAVFVMYEKLNANELESQELEGLRDTLLPKLLSGELSANPVELREYSE